MKVTNPNSSPNCVEVKISTDELQLLETALSYARRILNESEKNKLFGENLELEYLLSEIHEALQEFDKSQPELLFKDQLKKFVAKYQKWISDNYSEEAIREFQIDEAGYPHFKEIEELLSKLIKNNQLKELDREDKINLLYLIARNWDIGTLINWFSMEKPFSACGEMSDGDFLDLAKVVMELNQREFYDAKSQIASSLKKFEIITPEIEDILLTIYQTGNSYSKSQALMSLAKFGYQNIRNLIQKTWDEEDENERINCLVALEYLDDEKLLKEYLEKGFLDKRENISEFLNNLAQKNNKQ